MGPIWTQLFFGCNKHQFPLDFITVYHNIYYGPVCIYKIREILIIQSREILIIQSRENARKSQI